MSDSSDIEYSESEKASEVHQSDDSDEETVISRKRKKIADELSLDGSEEEESEEERPQKKPKKQQKRKRKLVAQFINEDVEVDSDDEEDEDDDYDLDGDIGVNPREREEAERYMRQQDQRRARMNRFADMSEDQMEEYFRTRHEVDSYRSDDDMDDTLKVITMAPEVKIKGPSDQQLAMFRRFATGDAVEVIRGELLGLQGRIISVEKDIAFIKPENTELKDTVAINLRELRKRFAIGDHVLIVGGRYEGCTGTVVRIEDNVVIVISDVNFEEMKVFSHNLQLSPHVSAVDSRERRPEDGKSSDVNGDENSFNTSANRSSFGRGDQRGHESSFNTTANGDRLNMRGVIIAQGRRDYSMLGKHVRITAGPLKAQYGIVKYANDSTVQVELHSVCKTIQVDRSRVQIVDEKGGNKAMYSNLARTPMGSQTPLYGFGGSRTPIYGSQTPISGNGFRTPIYGSQTPMSGNGFRTPNYGSRTPMSGNGFRTPIYGSQTPMSGNGFRTPISESQIPISGKKI